MRRKNPPDYTLITLYGILIIFGLIALSSASTAIAFQRFQDSYYYTKHQLLFGILPGLVILYTVSRIHYKHWRTMSLPLFIVAVLLLVAVLIPGVGTTYGRAKSWIVLAGVSFQPAELGKLALLLFLAAWFEKTGKQITDFKKGFIPFVIIFGIIGGLIALQPDIGTLSMITLIALTAYFIAGGTWKHIGVFLAAGVASFALLIKVAPYRAARLVTFLHPELDPQGVGYHINQALLAIGSGGIFGLGIGHSRQKFQYLPEVTGDSIFAIIAEEMGFVITFALVALLITLFWKGISIAKRAPDDFSRIVATGITVWFVGQAFINIAAMVGLMPLTGLPMPFVSYGGTAMIISMVALGVLINISRYADPVMKVKRR